MVFRSRGAVIFMHGCFWHRHEGCRLARLPKTKLAFWKPKLEQNRQRDIRHYEKLRQQGWRVLVVWECELLNLDYVAKKVRDFLEGRSHDEVG